MAADGDEKRVTVCSACLRASCWLGQFYCAKYRTANVVQKTVAELKLLAREAPFYWEAK